MRRIAPALRGFATIELFVVIAVVAIGLAVAQPIGEHAYRRALTGFAARGEPIGWLQHLQAAGNGLLFGAIAIAVYCLAIMLLVRGPAKIRELWNGLTEARADFKRHWKDE